MVNTNTVGPHSICKSKPAQIIQYFINLSSTARVTFKCLIFYCALSNITAGRVHNCCIHGSYNSVTETDTSSFHHLLTCSALSNSLSFSGISPSSIATLDSWTWKKEERVKLLDVSVLWVGKHRHVYVTLNGSLIPMMQFKWLLK